MSAPSASDRPNAPDDERAPGPKPLSRRASRLFVIASIIFVIAATAGSTYYLVNMTSRALTTPMDSTMMDSTAPPDTTTAVPDTLR